MVSIMSQILLVFSLLVLSSVSAQEDTTVAAEAELKNYTFQELQPCPLSSFELAGLGPNDDLEPCIIFDEKPPSNNNTKTSIIPIVQVTPHYCNNHRDGVVTGVQFINQDNAGRGVAIGYTDITVPTPEQGAASSVAVTADPDPDRYYVQFHLVSVIAGNPGAMTEAEYDRRHVQILKSMITALDAPYIAGTCSFASSIEKQVAEDHKAILMAQVGPPGFYQGSHPYTFGFHINSDLYPLPNVQSLIFLADQQKRNGGAADVPVRVIYRTKSEFFFSTCRSAIDNLQAAGFTDIEEYLFDHAADHDGDGDANQFDVDFLEELADQACPPGHTDDHDHEDHLHPALFVCTLTEQDVIVRRWLETGCRALSIWMTAATWNWADQNPATVAYFQGGGQWHHAFTYSDKYFESGEAMLAYNENVYGYLGNYDAVVGYSIAVLFAQHLESAYRVVDNPDPRGDFASAEGREILRRDMLVLKADTLFGPVAFDKNKRNIGREAAGSQWLPDDLVEEDEEEEEELEHIHFAEAATVIVADSAKNCQPGEFTNRTEWTAQGSLLKSGCSQCPVDTFVPRSTKVYECSPCPAGSTTDGMEGQADCYAIDDNLLSPGILAFGYVAVAVTWILGITFLGWTWYHRNDPVVRMSQREFLALICIGAMISSSTIIALSFQAGSDESTAAASAGCTAAPFLYAIGWALQYSSLSAKTYRLYLIMRNNEHLKRVKVTFMKMLRIVFAVLAIDVALLISWTVVSPLIYERSEPSTSVDSSSGVVTIESVGACTMEDASVSFWAFVGPIMGFHFVLLFGTNYLLYTVRNVADRYQEQKYIAMASILMFEILIVGIPVMIAVNDSPVATHIILVGIIAVSDIATLSLTFIPKVFYQNKGLEEGVTFGESIMRESSRRASSREFSQQESVRRASSREFSQQARNSRGLFSSLKVSESENSELDPIFAQGSGVNLMIESIAEEVHSDLEREKTSEEVGEAKVERSHRSQTSEATSEAKVDRSNRSQSAAEESGVGPSHLLNEHERMMEMTATLMKEHERMMQTTASIMNEHERYRQRLANDAGRDNEEQQTPNSKGFWPSQAQNLRAAPQIPREIETNSSEEEKPKSSGGEETQESPLPRQSEQTDLTEDTSKV
ncbi:MAG: hypothetical protein SGILL_006329 [Bacillariaceae sp.]